MRLIEGFRMYSITFNNFILKLIIMQKLQNMVRLSGYLGKDVELKDLPNGNVIAKTSLATNESYKSKAGDWVEKTYWHNLSAFGKLAENMQKVLTKGTRVTIVGQIHYSQYTDKNGVERNFTEIKVNEFLKLSKKEKVPF
jgi:single-strand DNA-binding protein